jgi:hypothetical protein
MLSRPAKKKKWDFSEGEIIRQALSLTRSGRRIILRV